MRAAFVTVVAALFGQTANDTAEIRVVDSATGRGVPLVELETVNRIRFVTDNAGRVAFREPELMNREIYLSLKSHGYETKKDGFGFAGAKVTLRPGAPVEIRVTRTMAAERLCRLTGEGRFRDSLLLGHRAPLVESARPGAVGGQDSVQAAVLGGRVWWFWGDTHRLSYPLGLFRTAGATTPLPGPDADLSAGLAYDYRVDKSGFARAMIPFAKKPGGVVWIDGVCVVPDERGVERMACHYSRRKGLAEELDHGIAVFDEASETFEPALELPSTEKWRHPRGHATRVRDAEGDWVCFGNPALVVRAPATLTALLDPKRYEAYARTETGWRWQTKSPPTDGPAEADAVRKGTLDAKTARFYPEDVDRPGERVRLHSGTTRWNEHRRKWVMLAGQVGGKTSHLGEVWYAEADAPTGPFPRAVRVVTHARMTFYNVCHHAFLDREGGRWVHFEGTYTSDFSGNPDRTPRYDYNQILYRLDLDAPAPRRARTPVAEQ